MTCCGGEFSFFFTFVCSYKEWGEVYIIFTFTSAHIAPTTFHSWRCTFVCLHSPAFAVFFCYFNPLTNFLLVQITDRRLTCCCLIILLSSFVQLSTHLSITAISTLAFYVWVQHWSESLIQMIDWYKWSQFKFLTRGVVLSKLLTPHQSCWKQYEKLRYGHVCRPLY